MRRAVATITTMMLCLSALCGEGNALGSNEDLLPQPRQHRPMPNYDGLPEKPPTAGEILIWIPRTLLYPAHVVLDRFVGKPLVLLGTTLEKYNVPGWAEWLLIWRDGRTGFVPLMLFEYELQIAGGALFFSRDTFEPGDKFSTQVSVWGNHSSKTKLAYDVPVLAHRDGRIRFDVAYNDHADWPFYGIGSNTKMADEAHYRFRQLAVALGASAKLFRKADLTINTGYRIGDADVDTTAKNPGDTPSIDAVFDVHDPAQVPGGLSSYFLLHWGASLVLDSRDPDPLINTGTGARLTVHSGYEFDPTNTDLQLLRWGGEGALFLDLSGYNHVLAVRTLVSFVEQLADATIPFAELEQLGGIETMSGFREGRFRGRSVFVLSAAYRYPVWTMLDANLLVSAGNAFDSHLDGFAFDKLHMSFAVGLRSSLSRAMSVDMVLGFGTSRLDAEEFEFVETRFVFGVNQGF